MAVRFGIGVDVHPLTTGRALVLGGVHIPHTHGLAGHSDGDVLTHSIIDAILGAAGLGDIGTHFPPGDEQYRGIDSTILLSRTVEIVAEHNWRVQYVDATIIAERPRLRPFISEIRTILARSLNISDGLVSVKATTTDGLGFTGRGEGITSMAVATLDDNQ
ncbi:MAG: 2-C-methyl-D-erythritol 2,4-cyclodiphosphate synthase [Chloroflexi bacterium]|nr:2-C-methyl-D-erythritol 2,4-cyclodiphosphate synthase [Chloroflexota bacterium]